METKQVDTDNSGQAISACLTTNLLIHLGENCNSTGEKVEYGRTWKAPEMKCIVYVQRIGSVVAPAV